MLKTYRGAADIVPVPGQTGSLPRPAALTTGLTPPRQRQRNTFLVTGLNHTYRPPNGAARCISRGLDRIPCFGGDTIMSNSNTTCQCHTALALLELCDAVEGIAVAA